MLRIKKLKSKVQILELVKIVNYFKPWHLYLNI